MLAMEEKVYLLKACTAWTLVDDFENLGCWDDSVKNSEMVQQIIKTEPIHNIKKENEFPKNWETNPLIDHDYAACRMSEKVLPHMEDVENKADKGDIVQMTKMRKHVHPRTFGDIIGNTHHNLTQETPKKSPTGACPVASNDDNQRIWQYIKPKPQNAVIYAQKCIICSCGSVLSVSQNLNISLRADTGQQYFRCPYCDSLFLLRILLGEQFPCAQYSHRCSQQSDPTTHLCTHTGVWTHSGDNPFKCIQCDKAFVKKSILDSHLAIHMKAKPYSCTQCSYRCSQRSHLTVHLRTHTGERPFTCDVCHKSFSERVRLKRHQRIHSNEKPYTCSTCGKSFKQSSNLKKHLLTHTTERAHKCEHCGKCFTQKGNLKCHTRTHTGEKPYSCQTCGKTFAQSSNRKKHSRQCTGTARIKEPKLLLDLPS